MTTENNTPNNSSKEGERIAKVMARAGVASRRACEALIEKGKVTVDGIRIKTPATFVTPEQEIAVDGETVQAAQHTRLWLYHKPAGLVTTHHDEDNRPTVFNSLPNHLPRVISIGRLDLNTEGLLLLTNDGALSRYAELPKTGWRRSYRVRVFGHVTQRDLDQLKNGLTIFDERTQRKITYGSIEASMDESKEGRNKWLTFTITEGKNREVRRICEYLDLQVSRLIRTSYGPFHLGELKAGHVEEITGKILKGKLESFYKQSK